MSIRAQLKKLLSIWLCLTLIMCALPVFDTETASAASNGVVRVRIATASGLTRVVVRSRGNYSVGGDSARPFTSGQTATVYVEGGQLHISIGDAVYDMGTSFKLVRHAPDTITNALSFSTPTLNNYFPGDMEFRLVSGSIQTVNHVFIEDYLRGVLSAEWSESGHTFESQKAMAIVARTKTRGCMNSPKGSYYDIRNTSMDQNYRGVVPSETTTARAVSETEGIVIRYNGSLIDGTYAASNGGQIETSKNWWGGSSVPYSSVKDDPYDYANPKSKVKRLTVYSDFASNIDKKGMSALSKLLAEKVADKLDSSIYSTDAGDITVVSVSNVYPHTPKYPDPSRVYTKMRFTLMVSAKPLGQDEAVTLTEPVDVDLDIFSQLDNTTFGLSLQSAHNELFTVAQSGGNFVIESRRWGHGVGYSQYGGEQMAKEGFNWRGILDFYYNAVVSYPTEKFSRPSLTELGDAPEPTVTPKPTALPDCVLFDTPLKATVNVSSTLNMRVEPNSGATVVTTLRRGDAVAAIGVIGDWTFIEYNDKIGYVMTKYINMTTEPMPTSDPGVTYAPTAAPTPTATPVIVPDGGTYMQVMCATYANLRSGPGTSYSSLAQLKNGTIVKLLGLSSNWSHVMYGDIEGYVSSSLLTAANTATATPAITATPAPTAEPTATAATSRKAVVSCSGTLNVRSAPSINASKRGTLKNGAEITVLYEENGWACIEYGTGFAFVNASYIRYTGGATAAPTPVPTGVPTAAPTAAPTATATAGTRTAYVNCTLLNVRASASTSGGKLGTLKSGAKVTVLSESNGWARISYNGRDGYVSAQYLRYESSPTAAPTATATAQPTATATNGGQSGNATIINCSSMNIRQLPTTESTSLGVISRGTQVYVRSTGYGVDSEWANIVCDGKTGYIKTKYLDFGPSRTPEPTTAPTAAATTAPTPVPTATATPGTGYIPGVTDKGTVTASELNMRKSASTSASTVYKLKRGATVDILGATADLNWYYVQYGNYEGYCAARYIQPFASSNSQIAESTAVPAENAESTTETERAQNTPEPTIVPETAA